MVVWNPNEIIGALLGGTLIAIASSMNLYLYGRITGISGSLNTLLKFDHSMGFNWKYAFVLGLITMPNLIHILVGN